MIRLVAEISALLGVALVIGLAVGFGLGRRRSPEHGVFAPAGSGSVPSSTAERWAEDVVALEADLVTVREQLAAAEAERSELEQKVEESAAGLRCQWAELVNARRRNTELERDAQSQRDLLTERADALERSTLELAERDREVARLSAELATRDAALTRLRGELFGRESELERLRSQGTAVGRQLVAFERQLPVLRQRAARAESESARINDQLREIEEGRRRIADLEHQLADTLTLRDQLVDSRGRELTARSAAADREVVVGRLQRRVERLEAEVVRLEARIAELEDELSTARSALNELADPSARPAWAPMEPAAPAARMPSAGTTQDDLTRIRGIGAVLERMLQQRGIDGFAALASLDDAAVDALQRQLPGFPDRIRRDRWVEQARHLLANDEEAPPDR